MHSKIPIRAAQNKERGRMRPAGCQFDMPALEYRKIKKQSNTVVLTQKQETRQHEKHRFTINHRYCYCGLELLCDMILLHSRIIGIS